MRTTIFVVLSLVSILWSSTASAWAFLFDIEFENQRGHSIASVNVGSNVDSGQSGGAVFPHSHNKGKTNLSQRAALFRAL